MTSNLEVLRQRLMTEQPDLYAYVSAVESAAAFDSAGDTAASARDNWGAANRIWLRAVRARRRAEKMLSPHVLAA